MLGVAVAAVVDAAARDDLHDRALAHKEVVVDHVVEAGFREHDRDVDVLVLGEGLDLDVDAVLVGLGDDLDVFGVLAVGLLAVGADVHRARGDAGHVGDLLQDFFLDVVQHVPFTSSRLQPRDVSARMRG